MPKIPIERMRIRRATVEPLTRGDIPDLPEEVVKRFPNLAKWKEDMQRLRQSDREATFRSFESLKLDRDEAEITEPVPVPLQLGSDVVAETEFGLIASAGNSQLAARADHTHGTPAAPEGTATTASVRVDYGMLYAITFMGS